MAARRFHAGLEAGTAAALSFAPGNDEARALFVALLADFALAAEEFSPGMVKWHYAYRQLLADLGVAYYK